MRAIVAFLLLGTATAFAGEPSTTVAIYWQPPGEIALGPAVRAAFIESTRSLAGRFADATTPAQVGPPSLAPALTAAEADYGRFEFAAALAKLDELQRLADARGGGDLDTRGLSEIFLYRGLCRLETGADTAAWDDLVRAARLDPGRVLDPQRFPPRAVAAYKRAAAEAAVVPRAELELLAPEGAIAHVDGAAAQGATSVSFGTHFITVEAAGYEPWFGVVTAQGAHVRVAAALHAYQAPDVDRLATLVAGARRVVLGALERTPTGWHFVVRDITLPEGKSVSGAFQLGETPVREGVDSLVRRLLPTPPRRRWWPYAVGGGVGAVVLAVSITLGVVLSRPAAQVVAK